MCKPWGTPEGYSSSRSSGTKPFKCTSITSSTKPDISIRPIGEGAKAVCPQLTNHCQVKTWSTVRKEFHYRRPLRILLPLSTKTAVERTRRRAYISQTLARLCKLFLSSRELRWQNAANTLKHFCTLITLCKHFFRYIFSLPLPFHRHLVWCWCCQPMGAGWL